MPKKKEFRFENIKRFMGKDGKIVDKEVNIIYDKEAEAYNQCISNHQPLYEYVEKLEAELKEQKGLEMVLPPFPYSNYMMSPDYLRGYEEGYRDAQEAMMKFIASIKPLSECSGTITVGGLEDGK